MNTPQVKKANIAGAPDSTHPYVVRVDGLALACFPNQDLARHRARVWCHCRRIKGYLDANAEIYRGLKLVERV